VGLRAVVRRFPVTAYVVLAYALSWSWEIPMLVRGDVVRAGIGWPTHLPALAGPAVAAVVVTALADGRSGLAGLLSRMTRWRVGWRWWLLVTGTAAFALLGFLLPLVTGSPVPGAEAFARYSGTGAIGLPAAIAVVFLVNGVGEETGWRGCAVERLLERHGPTTTAMVVAAVWAGWHLPLFFIDESFRAFGLLGTAGWTVGLVAASVVFTWIYRGTGHSILLVAAWHAAFNLTSGTEATEAVAAIPSTLVIIGAVWILRREAAGRVSADAAEP
jgi:membrane protease YdiL (CAAX protease family)